MKIVVSSRTKKQIKKLSKLEQIAIIRQIERIAAEFPTPKDKKISGYSSIYRTRVGHYRIICKRKKEKLHIILVGHRRDIYKIV